MEERINEYIAKLREDYAYYKECRQNLQGNQRFYESNLETLTRNEIWAIEEFGEWLYERKSNK